MIHIIFPFTYSRYTNLPKIIASSISLLLPNYFLPLRLTQLFLPEKRPKPDRHGELEEQSHPKPR